VKKLLKTPKVAHKLPSTMYKGLISAAASLCLNVVGVGIQARGWTNWSIVNIKISAGLLDR
jgi:hypothetical protein